MAKKANELNRKVLQNLRTSGSNEYIISKPLSGEVAAGEIIVQMGSGATVENAKKATGLWTLAADGATPVRFPSEERVSEMISSGAVAEVDAIEKAVGLNSDGTYIAKSDTNYLDNATTVEGEIDALDDALGALSGYVANSDFTLAPANDSIVISLKQEDGRVSGSSALITSRVITGYEDGTDSHVAANDTLGAALGKLQGQINNMNKAADADANKVVTTVTEVSGKVTETKDLLTNVKLSGYTVGGDAKLAETDTLGQALGKLQGQINGMDKAASAEDGKVVTTISETDGKVTETKELLKDVKLNGYQKDNGVLPINSADTVNSALSKLENTITANKIVNEDGSITVTSGASSTDIKVHVKEGEKVIKLDTNGGGLYTDIKISGASAEELATLGTNVREAYKLLDSNGDKLGDWIKIYKDSSLYRVYLGHVDDAITSPTDPTVIPGSSDTALCFIYYKADGTYELVAVDVQDFLEESEFKKGLEVVNHEVNVKIDGNSESFLTVSLDGLKLSGVQDAIDAAVNALNADVSDKSADNHVQVEVVEVSGKVTSVVVTTDDIASSAAVTTLSGAVEDEIARAKSAEAALDGVIGSVKGANDETRTYSHSGTKYLDSNDQVKEDAETLDSLLGIVSEGTTADTTFSSSNTVAKNISDIKKDLDAFKHKSELTLVDDNKYIETSVATAATGTTIGVSAITKTISTSTSSDRALADSYDVKQFAVSAIKDTAQQSTNVSIISEGDVKKLDLTCLVVDCGEF